MSTKSSVIFFVLYFLFFISGTYAQRSVSSQIAIGGANYLDTYLSPEKYRGTEVRFISEVFRPNGSWLTTLQHEAEVSVAHNRADNANELSGGYNFTYGYMHHWQLLDGALDVYGGGMGNVLLGFTYNMRNSANNPAQGYASLAVGPQIMAHYRLPLKIKGRAIGINYQMRMPWLGIMFSPNYGQSYYELFSKGNYDHNIVVTSLATFQMRQQLSIDLPLSDKTSLRLGYLSDIRQAKPNNLRQHHYFNAATIGVVIEK